MVSTGPAPVLERSSMRRPVLVSAAVLGIMCVAHWFGVGRWLAVPALVLVLVVALLGVLGSGYSLSRARHMRRNTVERVAHGLEHACIALLKKFGHDPTEGRTKDNTFVVGLTGSERATKKAVWQATEDAIRRIRLGQRELAYTPNCGTSLMTRWFLTALVMTGATVAFLVHGFTIATVLGGVAAYVAGRLLAYPLGLLVQHTMTVSTEFTAARVVNVQRTSDDDGDKKKILFVVELEVVP